MSMKSMMLLLLGLLAAPALAGTAHVAGTDSLPVAGQAVRYDAVSDRIAIQAQATSLTGLLAQISRQSGVEILIDPAVERPVTMDIKDQPLEQALEALTRGLNTVLVHDVRTLPGKGEQNVLVMVKLLPKGQTNTALLMPVLSPEAEAMLGAELRNAQDARQGKLVNERRMARLEKLSPEKRDKLEKIEAKKLQKEFERKAARAEDRAARKQDKLARLNDHLQRVQSYDGMHPERKQQKVEALQQQIAKIQAELSGTPAP